MLLALFLLPLSAFATKYSPPTEDPFYVSNFCLIKKELPPEIQFTFKDAGTAQLSTSKNSIILSTPFKSPLLFPKKMNPNHLPVALLVKGKYYVAHSLGFSESEYVKSPLAIGYSESVMVGMKGPISLVANLEYISEKEIGSFIEIPVNFYLGNQFIKNKLKVSVKKIKENNQDGMEIDKIQAETPLPTGLKITGQKFYDSKKTTLYSALKFNNSSDTPILFVKEFEQPVEDLNLLKENIFPFYIFNNGKCFKLAVDNEQILSRESGKKEYEKFYTEQSAPFKNLAENENVKEYLKNLKNRNLYEIFPLNRLLKGNGRDVVECGIKFHDFQNLFYEGEKTTPLREYREIPEKVTEITIPPELTRKLEMIHNGTKLNLHVVKRFVLNSDWKPLKEIYEKESECSPFCPDVFIKEKINYFKDTKINYPISPYKNEDLICGMPGKNGFQFNPNKYNSREDGFY